MPRFVRPAFLSARCDGRSSALACGPRSRDGSFSALVSLREYGNVAPVLRIDAGGSRDSARSTCEARTVRDSVLVLPDGRTVDVPSGSSLRFEYPQDSSPSRLVSDSGWRDPVTGAPLTSADVSARIGAARVARGA